MKWPYLQNIRSWFSRRWRNRWARVLIVAGGLGLGGFLFSASGILSIKASSGHWPITRWFLNFTKERSVATYALGLSVPALDVKWKIDKGAAHFDAGCRPCHGSPGLPPPKIPSRMTPPPPSLSQEVRQWEMEELFYIIKHGIKFTGMPAWPAKNRDDEIWAVVAFLKVLPELDQTSYQSLARGEPRFAADQPLSDLLPPRQIRDLLEQNCARCHGLDGTGRGTGAFPKLAGQKWEYLYASMKAYADGGRASGIMAPVALAIDDEVTRQLATFFSRLPPGHPIQNIDLDAAARGRVIAYEGIPSRRVAACVECHGPSAAEKNPMYPRLAGQHPEYLALQLELFGEKVRGGTRYAHLMHHAAAGLTPAERDAVAHFYASLKPDVKTSEQE